MRRVAALSCRRALDVGREAPWRWAQQHRSGGALAAPVPEGVDAEDYSRALREVSAQNQPVVELPDALASSITDWLSRPDESAPQGGYSGRHLRSGAKRLLGSLRERSRGFPAEPLTSTATVLTAASAQHLSPRARLALADALREGPPEAPAPQYSGSEVGAYAASRLPCTYAALQRVLSELSTLLPSFAPASLLDFGSGPGTAALAAARVWPGALRESVCVERSVAMLELADALRAALGAQQPAAAPPQPRCVPALSRLRGPAQQRRYDLVVAAYSLGELPDAAARQQAVRRLWAHTRDVLVLLEPGTPKASQAVRDAREEVLRLEARAQRARAKAHARGAPGQQTPPQPLPEPAGVYVLAPCAHDQRCPMDGSRAWCHFAQRVQRPPAQRLVKGAASARPFQDERFSFVILRRGPRPGLPGGAAAPGDALAAPAEGAQVAFPEEEEDDSLTEEEEEEEEEEESGRDVPASPAARALAVASAAAGWARLVRPPRRRSRHVVLDMCTPSGELERRTVAASHQRLLGPGSYALARKARWGDTWPHPPVGPGRQE